MGSSVRVSSEAWLLRGIGSVPGELKLADRRLSFTAFGFGTLWKWQLDKLEADAHQPGLADRMDGGENSVVFEVPITDVEVEFPWYYFGGGLKVRLGGVQYRFSLGRPPNTRMPVDRSDMLESLTRAVEEFQEVGKMRRLGEAWKNALSEPFHK